MYIKSMRLKFQKRSELKFVSRIDPELLSRDHMGFIPRPLGRINQ